MTTTVRANLSRFHPDYGKSPKEHEERKAKRAAGKLKFISKEETRNKWLGRFRKK
jgi:hypothetical protein